METTLVNNPAVLQAKAAIKTNKPPITAAIFAFSRYKPFGITVWARAFSVKLLHFDICRNME